MSVTSGFFNSVNGDRRYDARQMTALFNGIINDGIFANIGTAFAVNANGGNEVVIGVGRAWFNSTWVDNDALLPLTLDISEVLLDRYDAIVIEVDQSDAVRAGSIKVVKGTPSSSPVHPEMTHTNDVHQYPLAYIYRSAGSSAITQADITNLIGTAYAPYITGILQVQNIDNIVAQWQDEWAQWFANKTEETNMWSIERQTEFNEWFANLQGRLGDDPATTLDARVTELEDTTAQIVETIFIDIVPGCAEMGDKITALETEVAETKKSVSDGKTEVAGAITEMGVSTAADASFTTMANNIRAIETGVDTSDATATASYIYTGKTAYANGVKVTGTMPNLSANTTIKHSTSNGTKVIEGDAGFLSTNSDGVDRFQIRYNSENGYVTGNTLFGLTYAKTAAAIGLTAAKILQGNTILGIAGTGSGLSDVGNVSRTHYVYKGKTISAGDFVKTISGIGGVGTSSTASVQTSNVLMPYCAASNAMRYRGYAPHITCLNPTKVIRSWSVNQASGSYVYLSQVGTIDSTSNPNVIWGTAVQSATYTDIISRRPCPEVFERATDDGSCYVGVWMSQTAASTAGLNVTVYNIDGTVKKSATTHTFSFVYSGTTMLSGVKYIGNGKFIVTYAGQYSSSSYGTYALVMTYDTSTNTLNFGTSVQLYNYSSSYYQHYSAIDVWVTNTPNLVCVAYTNFVGTLQVDGTTLTLQVLATGTAVSTRVFTSTAYDASNNILMLASGAYSTSSGNFTLSFSPLTGIGGTISVGTTVNKSISMTTSLTNCVTTDGQTEMINLAPNVYYVIDNHLPTNPNAPDSTYFYPMVRAIVTYNDGTVTINASEYSDNPTSSFYTCELVEGTRKVIDMYGWLYPGTKSGNAPIYDVIKDTTNNTLTSINYFYETQVTLAESNSDIEGVAITSGSGGSATAHNQQVTVRFNV